MSDQTVNNLEQHREHLLPVLTGMVGVCVVFLSGDYFIGNLIYQIP